jgi:hypothetical protein
VAPSHALAFARASAKRWQGYVWAGLLSREMKAKFGVPTLSYWWKATPPVALSRAAGGPARSKNLGTHGISMRENREVPWSPVPWMVGAGREGNAFWR